MNKSTCLESVGEHMRRWASWENFSGSSGHVMAQSVQLATEFNEHDNGYVPLLRVLGLNEYGKVSTTNRLI
jgi:hypothetical protein